MNVGGGPPLRRTLVVDHNVRLGQKGEEAIGDSQLLGRRARVVAPARAPGVEEGALRVKPPDVFDHRRHRDPLRSKRPHERVVDVYIDDDLRHCHSVCPANARGSAAAPDLH